jgi:hypothetical protein
MMCDVVTLIVIIVVMIAGYSIGRESRQVNMSANTMARIANQVCAEMESDSGRELGIIEHATLLDGIMRALRIVQSLQQAGNTNDEVSK